VVFYVYVHIFIFSAAVPVGMEKKMAARRILTKDSEAGAVPASSVLLQFVCKKVKVLPELSGNAAREAEQQRDPLELPALESCSCY